MKFQIRTPCKVPKCEGNYLQSEQNQIDSNNFHQHHGMQGYSKAIYPKL